MSGNNENNPMWLKSIFYRSITIGMGALIFVGLLAVIDILTPDYFDPVDALQAVLGKEPQSRRFVFSPQPPPEQASSLRSSSMTPRSGDKVDNVDGTIKLYELESDKNPGFKQFAEVYTDKYKQPFDQHRLKESIKKNLDNMGCAREGADYVCMLNGRADANPSKLIFRWPLKLVWDMDTGEVLKVTERLDLLKDQFASGGVGHGQKAGSFVGVAIVCERAQANGSGTAGQDCSDLELRVAFSIATKQRVQRYPSVFRTIGFDWINRTENLPQTRLFAVELFALGALRKISVRLHDKKDRFLAADNQNILSSEMLDEWRKTVMRSGGHVRVGNRSDYQLGMSRGACAIVHPIEGAKIHPTAFTPILPSVARSFVLDTDGSVPCGLFINWKIESLGIEAKRAMFPPEKDFPAGYRLGELQYERRQTDFDPLVRGRVLALRATALTLYMLGFDILYSDTDQRIVGQWPHDRFIN